MGLLADLIATAEQDSSERQSNLAGALADDWKAINEDLRHVIAPVVDEVALVYVSCEFTGDGRARMTCEWQMRSTDVPRLQPIRLVYRRDDGWRLERRGREGDRVLWAVYVATYPDLVPGWQSAAVRAFLRAHLEEPPADESAIWVLADWNGESASEDDERVLVRFAGREVITALHALVACFRPPAMGASAVRVLSATVEVTSEHVTAYRTDAAPETPGRGLGEGLLLTRRTAASLRGEELGYITLEVRDDGVLLVRDDGRTGWATIDLTQLAAAVAGRG